MEENAEASGSSRPEVVERGKDANGNRRGKGRNQKNSSFRNRNRGFEQNQGELYQGSYDMSMAYGYGYEYAYGYDPSYGPYIGEDGTEYWDPSAFVAFPFDGTDPSSMGYYQAMGPQHNNGWGTNTDAGWSSHRKNKKRAQADGKLDEKRSKNNSNDDDEDEDGKGRKHTQSQKKRRRSQDFESDTESQSVKDETEGIGSRERPKSDNSSRQEGSPEIRRDGKDNDDNEDGRDKNALEWLKKRNGINSVGSQEVSIGAGDRSSHSRRDRQHRDENKSNGTEAGMSDAFEEQYTSYRREPQSRGRTDQHSGRGGMRRWGKREESDEKHYTNEDKGTNDRDRRRNRSASRSRTRDKGAISRRSEKRQSKSDWIRHDSNDRVSPPARNKTNGREESYRPERDSGWQNRQRKAFDKESPRKKEASGRSRRFDEFKTNDLAASSEQDQEVTKKDEYTNKALEVIHRPSAINRLRPRGSDQEDLMYGSDSDMESHGGSRRAERGRTMSGKRSGSDRAPVHKDGDAPPSDAMQAAIQAALGSAPRAVVKEDDDMMQDDEIIPVEENLPIPKLLRARPDEVYEQIAQVGEGTYGQVFKARGDKTGVIVALKKIRMESEKDGFPITAMREIKILQGLRHENVVRLHEMMLSKNSLYMVFEYLQHDLNGILSQSSIQFGLAHLKSLASQLLLGLAYLHRHSILHRDLKGSNLLLNSEGTLKLADFGLARRYTKRSTRNVDYTNRVVTLWYRPPELLFGETCYNDAIDVWGAGCIFIELFTRRPIFQGNDEIHQVQLLLEALGPIDKQEWPEVETLPWYDLVRPALREGEGGQVDEKLLPDDLQQKQKSSIYQLFGNQVPSDALDVAAALLSYNPARRLSASSALRMDYFTRNSPRPEKPRKVLERVIGDWHELESRQARRGIIPPPQATESNPQQAFRTSSSS